MNLNLKQLVHFGKYIGLSKMNINDLGIFYYS